MLLVLTHHMSGSSPRMWGTGKESAEEIVADRFIPTHVGNRCTCQVIRQVFAVHPHACGEQVTFRVPD